MNVSVSSVTQQQTTTAVAPVAKVPEVERTVPRAAAQPVHDTVTLSGQMPQKVVYGDPRIARNRQRQQAAPDHESDSETPENQPEQVTQQKK